MAKVQVLSLIPEQQITFTYCGPAAIRMILSEFGITNSQTSLWADVQNKSAGTTPVGGVLPALLFPKQVCHQCGSWYCWYTSPEAMAKTIAARGPYNVGAMATYPATPDAAVTAQIDSIDRTIRFPPAATIRGSNHWVVVNGYHLEDPALPGAAPQWVAGRQVNGVYILDPFDGPPVVRFFSTSTWQGVLKSIDCGPNTNAYPTVVGADRLILFFKWWMLLVLWFRRWPPLWPPGKPQPGGPTSQAT